MNNASIVGCGAMVPSRLLKNQYFNDLLGEDVDTWLRENLTITQRYWCAENESTSDLCLGAAKQALRNAGIKAEQLDLIVVATDTPEYVSPSTASKLQYLLSAKNAGSFDLNTACAGFVTALDVAAKYIRSDENYRYILVIGAYAMSKYLDLDDKKTVTLFADGAGAVILKAQQDGSMGFLASRLKTLGEYHDWMGIYAGGTYQPLDAGVLERKAQKLKFVKKFPKELNAQIWRQMITDALNDIGQKPMDVAHYFFTQININTIFQTMDDMHVPRERAHTVMDKYAYTGSACIPMAFNDAAQKGLLKPDDLMVFMGSGGGLAFACAVFRHEGAGCTEKTG